MSHNLTTNFKIQFIQLLKDISTYKLKFLQILHNKPIKVIIYYIFLKISFKDSFLLK